jgi:GDP-L-fucose synthase
MLTGGAGMLGRSLAEAWRQQRPDDELRVVTRQDVDLRDPDATRRLVAEIRPDAVVHAAARVGGIAAKLAAPLDYLRDNLLLDQSLIGAAIDLEVPELLYVGSAAVYPERCERPFVESDVLSGPLEPANEGYAMAKLAGGKLCEYASRQRGLAYRVVVPSNLYGEHDHFGSGGAHMIAAALTKVHRAQQSGSGTVEIWGDGTARREFTWAGDVAGWLVGQVGRLETWPALLNLGCGVDHSVTEYYEAARDAVGWTGDFVHDLDKPSGTPRRLLDSSAARALGWEPRTSLADGMATAYRMLRSQLD